MVISLQQLNSLTNLIVFSNSLYVIRFICLDQYGGSINLSTANCQVKIAAYGTDISVLTLSGNIVSTNTFDVYMGINTLGFSGKYTYQPQITMQDGTPYIPAQGIILFMKAIN